jgi:hypothetical protein
MNPYIPDWVRQRLTEDPSTDVRWILAAQPWFVIERVLPHLLKDTSPEVNHALAANPTLPEGILLKIPLLSHYTAALLAIHPKAGEQLQRRLEDFGFVLKNHIHSVFARTEDPF